MAEAVIDTSVVEAKLSESTLVENDEELVASQNASLDDIMSKIKVSTFGLKRNYSSIDISADKWLLTMDPKSLEKLSNSPSLADGLDAETEQDLRYLGCELIQAGSILLKLPQTASATGQILYQRFYYQKSFVRCNFEHHLIACLLLASKIEEAPRRPRDVINVYNRLKQLHRRRHSSNLNAKLEPLVLDAKYVTLKNNVIKAERRILNTLGFVVHVHHPHKLIYAYLHTLQVIDNKELLQKAWSYMNDGLRTDIFLRYKPETIACSCIYLAARTIENPVPLPKDPYPWYELYDASDRDVKTISEILMRLYQRVKPPNWTKLVSIIDKLHMELFKPEQPQEPPKPEPEEPEKEISPKKDLSLNGESKPASKTRFERKRRDGSSPEETYRKRENDRYKDRYRESDLPIRRRTRDRSASNDRDRSYKRNEPQERNGKYRKREEDDRDRERSYTKLDKDDRDYKERNKKEKKDKDRRKRSRSSSRDDRKKEKERERVDRASKQREKEIRRALGKRAVSSRSPSPLAKIKR